MEQIFQSNILDSMVDPQLLGLFPPFIIFLIITMLLEIDLTKGIKSFSVSFHRMIFKHFSGFIILLFYFWYVFALAEYHAGHYPIAMVKEFWLFPSLDRHSNFIATIGTFYFLYSGLFLWLNEYWLNGKLKNMEK